MERAKDTASEVLRTVRFMLAGALVIISADAWEVGRKWEAGVGLLMVTVAIMWDSIPGIRGKDRPGVIAYITPAEVTAILGTRPDFMWCGQTDEPHMPHIWDASMYATFPTDGRTGPAKEGEPYYGFYACVGHECDKPGNHIVKAQEMVK